MTKLNKTPKVMTGCNHQRSVRRVLAAIAARRPVGPFEGGGPASDAGALLSTVIVPAFCAARRLRCRLSLSVDNLRPRVTAFPARGNVSSVTLPNTWPRCGRETQPPQPRL